MICSNCFSPAYNLVKNAGTSLSGVDISFDNASLESGPVFFSISPADIKIDSMTAKTVEVESKTKQETGCKVEGYDITKRDTSSDW